MNLFKGKLIDKERINSYLDKSKLLKISRSIKEMLNTKITQEGVEKAMDDTKIGKSPGPDRLTTKFYKIIKKEIRVN